MKEYADTGDVKSLKFIFVDALDVDPTFKGYEKGYRYVKSKGLFEPHVELTPFDKSKWNDEDHWVHVKMDLIKNFSDERLTYMRKMAKVLLAEKIIRLNKEREKNGTTFN